MSKIAIILAAGQYTRWDKPYPKQLCPLKDGDSVLSRLIKQCRQYEWQPIITSSNPQILDFALDNNIDFFRPLDSLYTCSTVLSSHSCWRDKTLILCGDIVLTINAAATIFNTNGNPLFFGTHTEIFGLKFNENYSETLKGHLKIAIRSARQNIGYGKLWNLYRSIEGFNIKGRPAHIKWHHHGGFLLAIRDGSKDIDTIEDYEYVIKNLL